MVVTTDDYNCNYSYFEMDKYLNKRKHEDNTIDESEIYNGDNVAGPFQSSEMESTENKVQNYLLDGKYYKIISVEGTKIFATCQLCSKKIIAYNNSTGNLLSHYKVSIIICHT